MAYDTVPSKNKVSLDNLTDFCGQFKVAKMTQLPTDACDVPPTCISLCPQLPTWNSQFQRKTEHEQAGPGWEPSFCPVLFPNKL